MPTVKPPSPFSPAQIVPIQPTAYPAVLQVVMNDGASYGIATVSYKLGNSAVAYPQLMAFSLPTTVIANTSNSGSFYIDTNSMCMSGDGNRVVLVGVVNSAMTVYAFANQSLATPFQASWDSPLVPTTPMYCTMTHSGNITIISADEGGVPLRYVNKGESPFEPMFTPFSTFINATTDLYFTNPQVDASGNVIAVIGMGVGIAQLIISKNGGLTWVSQNMPIPAIVNKVTSFSMSQSDSGKYMMAAVYYGDVVYVQRSVDGGLTWEVQELSGSGVNSLNCDYSGQRCVLVAPTTVYLTDDAGALWYTAANMPSEMVYGAIDPTGQYVATVSELLNGIEVIYEPLPTQAPTLMPSPFAPAQLVPMQPTEYHDVLQLVMSDGAMYSIAAVENSVVGYPQFTSFSLPTTVIDNPPNSGKFSMFTNSMCMSGDGNRVIVVGSMDEYFVVYALTNQSLTTFVEAEIMSPLLKVVPMYCAMTHSGNVTVIGASNEGTLLHYVNNGESPFVPVLTPFPTFHNASQFVSYTNPQIDASGTVIAVVGTSGMNVAQMVISRDGGVSWSTIDMPYPTINIQATTFSMSQNKLGQYMLAAVYSSSGLLTIQRSVNGGSSWEMQQITATGLKSLNCDYSGQRCVLVTPSAVYLTDDAGASWYEAYNMPTNMMYGAIDPTGQYVGVVSQLMNGIEVIYEPLFTQAPTLMPTYSETLTPTTQMPTLNPFPPAELIPVSPQESYPGFSMIGLNNYSSYGIASGNNLISFALPTTSISNPPNSLANEFSLSCMCVSGDGNRIILVGTSTLVIGYNVYALSNQQLSPITVATIPSLPNPPKFCAMTNDGTVTVVNGPFIAPMIYINTNLESSFTPVFTTLSTFPYGNGSPYISFSNVQIDVTGKVISVLGSLTTRTRQAQLLKSIDGGQNWNITSTLPLIDSTNTLYFSMSQASNGQYMLTATYVNMLYVERSIDGGVTWELMTLVGGTIKSLQCDISGLNCILVTAMNVLLTTDAGATWVAAHPATSAIQFGTIDPTGHIIAMVSAANNGIQTIYEHVPTPAPTSNPFSPAQFDSFSSTITYTGLNQLVMNKFASYVVAVDSANTLLSFALPGTTIDNPQTSTVSPFFVADMCMSIDGNRLIVVGETNVIYAFLDKSLANPVQGQMESSSFTIVTDYCAMTGSGNVTIVSGEYSIPAIYINNGESPFVPIFKPFTNFPNATDNLFYSNPQIDATGNIIATITTYPGVGVTGVLIITKNGGVTWETLNSLVYAASFGITFSMSQTDGGQTMIHLMGYGGTYVERSTDGGLTWQSTFSAPSDYSFSLDCDPTCQYCVVASSPNVYLSNNGGANWYRGLNTISTQLSYGAVDASGQYFALTGDTVPGVDYIYAPNLSPTPMPTISQSPSAMPSPRPTFLNPTGMPSASSLTSSSSSSSLSDGAVAGVVIGVIAVVSVTVAVLLVLNGVIKFGSSGSKTALLDHSAANPMNDQL
jgi:photosystem II stability/assembly factor-like uncharacterized protein